MDAGRNDDERIAAPWDGRAVCVWNAGFSNKYSHVKSEQSIEYGYWPGINNTCKKNPKWNYWIRTRAEQMCANQQWISRIGE